MLAISFISGFWFYQNNGVWAVWLHKQHEPWIICLAYVTNSMIITSALQKSCLNRIYLMDILAYSAIMTWMTTLWQLIPLTFEDYCLLLAFLFWFYCLLTSVKNSFTVVSQCKSKFILKFIFVILLRGIVVQHFVFFFFIQRTSFAAQGKRCASVKWWSSSHLRIFIQCLMDWIPSVRVHGQLTNR